MRVTQLRVQAINIAREGIEAVENIRDTNWLKFSSDIENCWKTFNYDHSCIGNTTPPSISDGDYTLYRQGSLWFLRPDGTAVYPALVTTNDAISHEQFVDELFQNMLMRDPVNAAERDGYVAQLVGGTNRSDLFNTFLTLVEYTNARASINVGVLDADFLVLKNSLGLVTQLGDAVDHCSANRTTECHMRMTRRIRITNPDADTLRVESIVEWTDPSRSDPYSITLPMTLTNWREDL